MCKHTEKDLPRTDPDTLDGLRKNVKHLMVDLGLDREGSYDRLLPLLGEKMGRTVAKSTLSSAMTGYKNGPATQSLLEALRDMLSSWAVSEKEPFNLSEHIHPANPKDNE